MRSGSKIQLENIDGEVINPATEDKELIGNTQADGAGTKYHITTDSSGRLHTRSFKNAAGDGRRMLVDSDRHGQVDVLSLPDGLTGFEVPAYNYIALTYVSGGDADNEIETVVYRQGGSGGTIVCTLTLGYTGSNLTAITKT